MFYILGLLLCIVLIPCHGQITTPTTKTTPTTQSTASTVTIATTPTVTTPTNGKRGAQELNGSRDPGCQEYSFRLGASSDTFEFGGIENNCTLIVRLHRPRGDDGPINRKGGLKGTKRTKRIRGKTGGKGPGGKAKRISPDEEVVREHVEMRSRDGSGDVKCPRWRWIKTKTRVTVETKRGRCYMIITNRRRGGKRRPGRREPEQSDDFLPGRVRFVRVTSARS